MKKANLSPVTSLLVSLSLALGILVSDLSGYKFLTSAQAQTDPCSGRGVTVVSDDIHIGEGLSLSGIAVRNVLVNGQLVEEGVIAGSVLIVDSAVNDAEGVIVGNDAPLLNGVIVGNDIPSPNGVIVGNDVNVSGTIISTGSTANGGTLTGDGVTVTGGVITGQNLLLSGSTIEGGSFSLSGEITRIEITPAN